MVRPGDTLGAIARGHGTTTANLIDLNGIHNPNRLSIGQRITIRKKQVCSIVPLFIDRDRNPIQGLRYRLESAGAAVFEGVSQLNGLGEQYISKAQGDIVRISVQRLDGTWKAISEVEAWVGEKLVTLKSGKIRIRTQTEPHPMTPDGVRVKDQARRTTPAPALPGTPKIAKGMLQSPVANGQNLGIKALPDKTPQGAPVTKVSKDLPDLQKYFALYTGDAIAEQDWSDAATRIGCEIAVIKAFAQVESRGAGFDKQHRPVILYERHLFSKHTNHQFDSKNADISSSKRYTRAKFDKQKHPIADDDRYGHSYERFEKAFHLSQEGAIQASSWGKFQVLGENYKALNFHTPQQLMEAACQSERMHLLRLFVPFSLTKNLKQYGSLRDALVQKNWVNAAILYNGTDYQTYRYDEQLKEAYEKIKAGV